MANGEDSVVARLVLRDEFSQPYEEAGRNAREAVESVDRETKELTRTTDRLTRSFRSGFSFAGRLVSRLGRQIRSSLVPGLGQVVLLVTSIGAIAGAARGFSEFEESIAEVSTIVDTATVSVDQLRTGVLELARAQATNERIVARGLYQAISSGVEAGAVALGFLEQASRLAIVGVTDTASAVDVLTSALNAYGITSREAVDLTEETSRISDILFTTVRLGKTTIDELSSSLGQVLPIASQVGVSLEEVNAAVAALTLSGLSTSEAVTQLRSVLVAFTRGGNEAARAALGELGDLLSVDAIRAKGLQGALQDLVDAVGGSETQIISLLGRVEAASAAFALAGNQAGAFTSTLNQLRSAGGVVEGLFERRIEEPVFRAQQLLNALRQDLEQIIGGDVVRSFVEAVEIAGGFETVTDNLRVIFTAVGQVAGGLLVTIGELGAEFARFVQAAGGPEAVSQLVVQGLTATGQALRAVGAIVVDLVENLLATLTRIPSLLGSVVNEVRRSALSGFPGAEQILGDLGVRRTKEEVLDELADLQRQIDAQELFAGLGDDLAVALGAGLGARNRVLEDLSTSVASSLAAAFEALPGVIDRAFRELEAETQELGAQREVALQVVLDAEQASARLDEIAERRSALLQVEVAPEEAQAELAALEVERTALLELDLDVTSARASLDVIEEELARARLDFLRLGEASDLDPQRLADFASTAGGRIAELESRVGSLRDELRTAPESIDQVVKGLGFLEFGFDRSEKALGSAGAAFESFFSLFGTGATDAEQAAAGIGRAVEALALGARLASADAAGLQEILADLRGEFVDASQGGSAFERDLAQTRLTAALAERATRSLVAAFEELRAADLAPERVDELTDRVAGLQGLVGQVGARVAIEAARTADELDLVVQGLERIGDEAGAAEARAARFEAQLGEAARRFAEDFVGQITPSNFLLSAPFLRDFERGIEEVSRRAVGFAASIGAAFGGIRIPPIVVDEPDTGETVAARLAARQRELEIRSRGIASAREESAIVAELVDLERVRVITELEGQGVSIDRARAIADLLAKTELTDLANRQALTVEQARLGLLSQVATTAGEKLAADLAAVNAQEAQLRAIARTTEEEQELLELLRRRREALVDTAALTQRRTLLRLEEQGARTALERVGIQAQLLVLERDEAVRQVRGAEAIARVNELFRARAELLDEQAAVQGLRTILGLQEEVATTVGERLIVQQRSLELQRQEALSSLEAGQAAGAVNELFKRRRDLLVEETARSATLGEALASAFARGTDASRGLLEGVRAVGDALEREVVGALVDVITRTQDAGEAARQAALGILRSVAESIIQETIVVPIKALLLPGEAAAESAAAVAAGTAGGEAFVTALGAGATPVAVSAGTAGGQAFGTAAAGALTGAAAGVSAAGVTAGQGLAVGGGEAAGAMAGGGAAAAGQLAAGGAAAGASEAAGGVAGGGSLAAGGATAGGAAAAGGAAGGASFAAGVIGALGTFVAGVVGAGAAFVGVVAGGVAAVVGAVAAGLATAAAAASAALVAAITAAAGAAVALVAGLGAVLSGVLAAATLALVPVIGATLAASVALAVLPLTAAGVALGLASVALLAASTLQITAAGLLITAAGALLVAAAAQTIGSLLPFAEGGVVALKGPVQPADGPEKGPSGVLGALGAALGAGASVRSFASGGATAGPTGRWMPVAANVAAALVASGAPAFQGGGTPGGTPGTVSSPHVAVIGEGPATEAIVPLADNRAIPVQFLEPLPGRLADAAALELVRSIGQLASEVTRIRTGTEGIAAQQRAADRDLLLALATLNAAATEARRGPFDLGPGGRAGFGAPRAEQQAGAQPQIVVQVTREVTREVVIQVDVGGIQTLDEAGTKRALELLEPRLLQAFNRAVVHDAPTRDAVRLATRGRG